jgi:hypothetical protein
LTLVQPARPELRLLDPQVTRELGVVAAHLLDEVVGVLATNVSIASPSVTSVSRAPVVGHRELVELRAALEVVTDVTLVVSRARSFPTVRVL